MSFLTSVVLSSSMAFAQTQVSGVVISQDDGEPIIGASVTISGGQNH